MNHRLPAAHPAREIALQFNPVPALRQVRPYIRWNARFNHYIASAERQLRKSRRFERSLNIHSVIHHVGNELRVRLRLVEAAHDAKSDMYRSLLHKRRNDRMKRPLAPRERVWMLR